MGLRDRVRSLERKAQERGVQVCGPRLFLLLPRDDDRREQVRVARARGRAAEIIATIERHTDESANHFADRVEREAERVCQHRQDGMVLVHFGATIDDADSFYSYD